MRCPVTPAWAIKVVLGLALIAHFILVTLRPDLLATRELLTYPLFLGLVLIGGTMNLGHYIVLEHYLHRDDEPGLITDRGLFRWIRHPMYVGDAILYLAFALYPASLVTGAIYPVALVALWRQSRHEDRQLAEQFPEAHARWREQAGLWWPGRGLRLPQTP
jgi:protein-S-isoprenylcysteine O-methyltransferase Ste14